MRKAKWTRMLLMALLVPPVAAQGRTPDAGAGASTAGGQTYPNRPIRMIIPFTGGSATDGWFVRTEIDTRRKVFAAAGARPE